MIQKFDINLLYLKNLKLFLGVVQLSYPQFSVIPAWLIASKVCLTCVCTAIKEVSSMSLRAEIFSVVDQNIQSGFTIIVVCYFTYAENFTESFLQQCVYTSNLCSYTSSVLVMWYIIIVLLMRVDSFDNAVYSQHIQNIHTSRY